MPIILLVCLIAVVAAAVVQYVVFRVAKKWYLRAIPLAVTLAVTVTVTLVRYFGWSADHGGEKAPIETLLFIPGLPAVLVLVGLYVGWRVWRRRWMPRVINEK